MKKHSRLERAIAKLIHNARTVKLEDLEKDALEVTTTELYDIGEFDTVDALYSAIFDEREAPYYFERELNRAATGQAIQHGGVQFLILRTEPNEGAKTIAIETASGKNYVCKLNNVCVNKLLLTIS
jgi:hypothetical protein